MGTFHTIGGTRHKQTPPDEAGTHQDYFQLKIYHRHSILTPLHSERPKLDTILAFLSAIRLNLLMPRGHCIFTKQQGALFRAQSVL